MSGVVVEFMLVCSERNRPHTRSDYMLDNTQDLNERVAVIRVIGVGGGGSNAVDRMVADGVQIVVL